MKKQHNNTSEDQYLPEIGLWAVASIVPPLAIPFTLIAATAPLGKFSWIRQISNSRSDLLPMLVGSQLGVSALVIAMSQFHPGRWNRTPRKLGDRWLVEVRRVASQENRFIACSLGLIGISSIIVFGVAACIFQRIDAGGILLLAITWGVHVASCAVLILIPITGVAAITSYRSSLDRLTYIAEVWPKELKAAKKEGKKRPSLSRSLKRWTGVAVLVALFGTLTVAALIGDSYFDAPRTLLLQCGVADMVIAATVLSIGAGYMRWSPTKYFRIIYWFSWPLLLCQGLILEFGFIAITTDPSPVRNWSIVSAIAITLLLAIPLSWIASGSRTLWSRLKFLRTTLISIWISDIRRQRRCGLRCSDDEREALSASLSKWQKEERKDLPKP